MVEMIVFVCRTLRQKCAHSTIAGCGRAQAEHNGKYKDNLTGGSPQKCMVTKDCYVGRALERLTVTTMMLCCDSTAVGLVERPASAGLCLIECGYRISPQKNRRNNAAALCDSWRSLIFDSLNHFFYPRIEGFFAAGVSREFGDDFIVFVGDNIRNRINFECG